MAEDRFIDLQPGTIVNGRYEVVKCLGTGSMGVVYACRHRDLSSKIVAMKVLFSEVARDKVALERFRNEIVASYEVNHPNVVRAFEYFKDGELLAFTMEFVGGGDLADRITSDEIIEIPDIVSMLRQMCSGVQAIHEKGIVHRDLKPENILITIDGDVKITDFGIALSGLGPKLTEYGGIVGTIDYVSPEYLESGQVDLRCDIYAIGVLAYEMITGEAPFKGKTVIETMTLRLRTDPVPPHNLRQNCPIVLSNIVLKAMHRDPKRRYQTALEMYEDLTAFSEGREVSFSRADGAGTVHGGRKGGDARGSEGTDDRLAQSGTRRSIPAPVAPPAGSRPRQEPPQQEQRGGGRTQVVRNGQPAPAQGRGNSEGARQDGSSSTEEFWQESGGRRGVPGGRAAPRHVARIESQPPSGVPARRAYASGRFVATDQAAPEYLQRDESVLGRNRNDETHPSRFSKSVTIADKESLRRMQSILNRPQRGRKDSSVVMSLLMFFGVGCLVSAIGIAYFFFVYNKAAPYPSSPYSASPYVSSGTKESAS